MDSAGLQAPGQDPRRQRPRSVLLPVPRPHQPGAAGHRAGEGRGHRHGDQGHRAQDLARAAGTKVDSAVEGLKLLAAGQGGQLRGRQRPVRLHRDRRHPRLPVPLRAGREGQVRRLREGRLTPLLGRDRPARRQRAGGRHAPRGAGHRLHARSTRCCASRTSPSPPTPPSAPSPATWPTPASGCPPGRRVARRLPRSPALVGVVDRRGRAAGRCGRPGALTTAIAAVALTIVLENVVRFVFGNDLRGYDLPLLRDWQLRRAPHRAAAGAELRHRRRRPWPRSSCSSPSPGSGKAMRAVADNPDLAGIKGIDAGAWSRAVTLRRHGAGRGRAACCSASTPASIR